jgi:hypothetical protein
MMFNICGGEVVGMELCDIPYKYPFPWKTRYNKARVLKQLLDVICERPLF